MIAVTRLDGSALIVNAELIGSIEQTPDTLISLINGEMLLVKESAGELVARTIAYKRQIAGRPAIGRAVPATISEIKR